MDVIYIDFSNWFDSIMEVKYHLSSEVSERSNLASNSFSFSVDDSKFESIDDCKISYH